VPLHNVVVYDHQVDAATLEGLNLIFLSGEIISEATLDAVEDLVKHGATCVLPPRLAPRGSGFELIRENTLVPDSAGQWLIIPEFYSLHYETFCAGPVSPLLRETLSPLIGDGDTLIYDFDQCQVNIRQAGGDYPRHEIMTWHVPLTQAGTNADILEVEFAKKP
jgi:hypothetical protein